MLLISSLYNFQRETVYAVSFCADKSKNTICCGIIIEMCQKFTDGDCIKIEVQDDELVFRG